MISSRPASPQERMSGRRGSSRRSHGEGPQSHPAARFRLRLFAAMMVVISAITAAALYSNQRNAETGYERSVREEFQGQVSFQLGEQEARQAAVADRCRHLARSVRIRAALEEDDVEDLYANAAIELRDLLGPAAGGERASGLQADFCRFLNNSG